MEEYGVNTELVEKFIVRLRTLSKEEIEKIAARVTAWYAARVAAWDTARYAARVAAWDTARVGAWDTAWDTAQDAAWVAAWVAAWDAACAVAQTIVVIDLISAEHFAILTEPFAEILAELGIVKVDE